MTTIIDVAKKAGVSKSTISRYLNGEKVRDENRIKIEKAIKEMNYQINPMARGLKTSKSYTIGVIIPNIIDLFATHIIQTCEQYLNEKGYSIILCDSRENLNIEKNRLEFLRSKRVDGIIMQPCRTEGKHIKTILNGQIPIVLIDRMIPELKCDCVMADNFKGAYDGVSALIHRGHRKIGIIIGPEYIYTAFERFEGYKRAMQEHGLPLEKGYIENGEFKKEEGKNAFLKLMKMKDRPTAIFVTNYFMTIGVIEAILEQGYKIPDDVSILAFDSLQVSTTIDWSAIIKPNLSTIRQPMAEIGIRAAELLIQRIEKPEETYIPQVIRLPTQITLTESVVEIL